MNRIILLVLFLIFGSLGVYAQVGIGTETPHPSTLLDVVGKNKGIMIPRVALTSKEDTLTMYGGNINSLLVFNTTSSHDLEVGYHYWYDGAWRRLSTAEEIDKLETLTKLDALGDGVFVYTSEDGTETTIDIPAELLDNLLNEGVVYQEIMSIVNLKEKITVLEDHGGGSYTYYSEKDLDDDGLIVGKGVKINVISDVYNELLKEEGVLNEYFVDLVGSQETLTRIVDNEDGTFSFIDENGDTTNFNANTTTAVEQNGIYEFFNTAGESIIKIDINASALSFDNATGNIQADNVQDAIEELSMNLEVLSAVKHINGDYTLSLEDQTILADASTGSLDIILPDPSQMKGKRYTIKKSDTNQNSYINVTGDIDQIGVEITIYTGVPYTGWDLISDGDKWQIVNTL